MPYPLTLQLDNRSDMVQCFSIQAKVFWNLPFSEVFLDRADVRVHVDQKGVKRPVFNRSARVDNTLELLPAELLVRLPGQSQDTSLIIDLPSMF
jgi:hypothetical protein